MKKIAIIIIFLLINISNISASDRKIVTLNKCVDGDTAWFNLDSEAIKARFLAIDTPESTNKIEEYGHDASNYTCNLLTNADTIEIEYDPNSDKIDKYDRHLVWVFIDNELLQEKIVEQGYSDIKYIYGDYKYLDKLDIALNKAKSNKVNLWSDSENTINYYDYITVFIGVVIIIILFLFNKKYRKKIINKTKRKAVKAFENSLKNIK